MKKVFLLSRSPDVKMSALRAYYGAWLKPVKTCSLCRYMLPPTG